MSASWLHFSVSVGGLVTCSTVPILPGNFAVFCFVLLLFVCFPVPSHHHLLSRFPVLGSEVTSSSLHCFSHFNTPPMAVFLFSACLKPRATSAPIRPWDLGHKSLSLSSQIVISKEKSQKSPGQEWM